MVPEMDLNVTLTLVIKASAFCIHHYVTQFYSSVLPASFSVLGGTVL